jgi:adenylate cyclase, class 2
MTWPPPAPGSPDHPGAVVIEAEIKAHVRDVAAVQEQLRARAAEQVSDYHDTYYDLPGQVLTGQGRELRVRVIDTGGRRRCLLTYKSAAVDASTGSKPETETEITDPAAMDQILRALGFIHLVAFDKHCANYAFTAHGRQMLATLVTVPELDGTFLEVETMTPDGSNLSAALAAIRAVLGHLGITDSDLTTEQYTAAVMRHRSVSGP